MSGLLDLVKPRRSLSRRKRADRLFAACGAGAVFLVGSVDWLFVCLFAGTGFASDDSL